MIISDKYFTDYLQILYQNENLNFFREDLLMVKVKQLNVKMQFL